MKSMKIKQYVVSFLALLSLFAYSISACERSYQQEKKQTVSASCHEHSPTAKAAQNRDDDSSKKVETIASETGGICLQPAPKLVAKSETIKFEKHLAVILIVKPIEIAYARHTVSAKNVFSKPFCLSDSFYNLSHGRAPPHL